jgi:hypothetical protein
MPTEFFRMNRSSCDSECACERLVAKVQIHARRCFVKAFALPDEPELQQFFHPVPQHSQGQ